MYKMMVIGNLTGEPKAGREVGGETSANFSIAANTVIGGKKVTEFFSCIAFSGCARFALNYLHKGNPVYAEGEPHIYIGKDGRGRFDLTVRVLESMSNRTTSSTSGLPQSLQSAEPSIQSANTGATSVDMTEDFLRTGNIVPPPAPEPVENVKLPWDDGGGKDDDLPF